MELSGEGVGKQWVGGRGREKKMVSNANVNGGVNPRSIGTNKEKIINDLKEDEAQEREAVFRQIEMFSEDSTAAPKKGINNV